MWDWVSDKLWSKGKKNTFPAQGVLQKKSGVSSVVKKRLKLDSKKVSLRMRVVQTGGKLQNYLVRAIYALVR